VNNTFDNVSFQISSRSGEEFEIVEPYLRFLILFFIRVTRKWFVGNVAAGEKKTRSTFSFYSRCLGKNDNNVHGRRMHRQILSAFHCERD